MVIGRTLRWGLLMGSCCRAISQTASPAGVCFRGLSQGRLVFPGETLKSVRCGGMALKSVGEGGLQVCEV